MNSMPRIGARHRRPDRRPVRCTAYRRGRSRTQHLARGLVLLALLIALALASIAALAGLDVWALEKQRQQEAQLLFVGNQYRLAIQRYFVAGRTLPATIDDLIDDKRFPIPLHHLRRAYPDPITGKNDWQLLRDGNGIYGVYSSSDRVPIKHANFPRQYAFFDKAETYADWKFFYPPPGWRGSAAAGVPSTPWTPSSSTPLIRLPGSRTR
jgi:type II secretory pathway pseudopilin PulG